MTDEEMLAAGSKEGQMNRLRAIMHRLRAPGGCPWDAEQTHESILSHLLEETYEVVDTIRRQDYTHLKEELGDLLLQVVFHAEIAAGGGRFDLDDIAQGICEKLIRRHPHVFTDSAELSPAGVLTQWEEIKRKEKGQIMDLPYLHQVGDELPALLAAQKIQKKASKVGFDWDDTREIIAKIREEIEEVEAELVSGNEAALEEEIGDLLFAVVNLPRKLKKDSELLLHAANEKFKKRFSKVESAILAKGGSLAIASLEEMEEEWERAKKA